MCLFCKEALCCRGILLPGTLTRRECTTVGISPFLLIARFRSHCSLPALVLSMGLQPFLPFSATRAFVRIGVFITQTVQTPQRKVGFFAGVLPTICKIPSTECEHRRALPRLSAILLQARKTGSLVTLPHLRNVLIARRSKQVSANVALRGNVRIHRMRLRTRVIIGHLALRMKHFLCFTEVR